MTRKSQDGTDFPANRQMGAPGCKARFSEVVRKAKTEGPQRITVHGREEVVVVSVEEYRRVKGEATCQALVKLLGDFENAVVEHRPQLRGDIPVTSLCVAPAC